MSDYTVEEVSETAQCFVQNVCNIFEEVNERWDALETLYLDIIDQGFKKELAHNTERLIDSEYHKHELFVTNVNENKVNMENLESSVQKLRLSKSKAESECSHLEHKVTALRNKINSVLEEKENISKKMDEIITYKVLTNVAFVYSTRKVAGLVNKKVPAAFSLNPEELSQEEITQKLWHLVLGK